MSWIYRIRPVTSLALQRKPAVSSFSYLGNRYLTSDGLAGSYADAATSAAARVVFGGASAPTCTVSFWAQSTGVASQSFYIDVSDDGAPRLSALTLDNDELDTLISDTSTPLSGSTAYSLAAAGWHHVAYVSTAGDVEVFLDGVGSGASSNTGTWSTVDALTLFADYAHANRLAGSLRNVCIYSSALSAGNVSSLYGLGETGDPRTAAGGPTHWWPGDGDSGTTITDRGSAGTCNLTLHGGVTIGTDP